MFKVFLGVALGCSLSFAANNSQATHADIKEAVYKLILQNKNGLDRDDELNKRVVKIENMIVVNEKDALQLKIDSFVEKNKQAIEDSGKK